MRILFLSDNFPPEVNAPASRTFEHCRHWASAGHRVTVITCAPNFPGGKVFQGYRNRLWSKEDMDGIEVIRVWTYITANKGFIKRTLDYLTFMISASIAGLFIPRPDVIVGTSPQFFTAVAARILGTLRRRPWVFELRDIWPESIRAVGAMRTGRVLRALELLEMHLYRHARRVVAVSHAFKRHIVARGIDPSKVAVITNGVDLSRYAPQPKDAALVAELDLGDCFAAGYIGTHGLAHALETLLDAAELLQSNPTAADVRILMLGDGAKKSDLTREAGRRGLANVLFRDSVGKEEVIRYWSVLDASIIHLRKTPLFETTIPSKMFEAMGMGIPILMGVAGEAGSILQQADAGMLFEPENAEQLVEALLTLKRERDRRERYGANARRVARQYDRAYLAEAMLQVLKEAA
jgi:glycosyltransferase involved in cell wall biosynthesis